MAGSIAINYARFEGINRSELGGAVVMAIAFAVLFVFNVVRSIRHTTYVLVVLSIFCLIRVTAFTMRAVLSGNEKAGENLNVVIAEGIIYSVGFFGLVYSAYTLVLDRLRMMRDRHSSNGLANMILGIICNRRLVRIGLLVAVSLGVAAGSLTGSDSQSTLNIATALHRASIYIFLAIVASLVIVTANLAYDEHKEGMMKHEASIGRQYRVLVLLAIAFLCLTRESFYAATAKDSVKQNNAHLWYPLSALPELLAVMLFAAPGLVPSRRELAEATANKRSGSGSHDAELQHLSH
ncbi:hypothetical protein PHLGIDRAFT_103999 [Phlebiopsis gigantea 11061_1 CR5-6]|uniref:DUF7702 domain-containing protein n=1 Tax=Phlebiopsis gigantea (strain 11061_1 CR5-6) TaxID=745531 RepID=A0A0C3S9W0_PHLG1|nr:hypothetical protein PHLGIDRAFT_103999 [Phlebiopsis gigantea 11061_1 CR5-6]